MKRLFSVLAVLIFALSFSLAAKITKSASPEVLIKTFNVTNLVGEPLDSATAQFDPDTIDVKDLIVAGVVDSVIDATHVRLECTIRYNQWKASKMLTISTDAVLWLPDSTWKQEIPDSLFSLFLLHSRSLVVGEKFELSVEPLGETIVITEHPLSRLTIKTTCDTFTTSAGVVATDWFSANDGNLTLFTKMNTIHTDTTAQIAYGYQLSWDKVITLLPMDDATALNDTSTTIDNDITARRGRWNYASFTHPICKWMRIIYYYKSSTGRVSVDTVAAVTGN